MAKLDYLVIHCTDTPEGRHTTAKDIVRWHTSSKEVGGRGWDRVGYSDMVYIDGDLVNLTPFNYDSKIDPWEMTWGAKGINARSRHMVYVGGMRFLTVISEDGEKVKAPCRQDTRNAKQMYTMEIYVKYMILRHPDIKVAGHYHFSKKPCPSFDVEEWLKEIGVEDKNIYHDGKD